MTAATAIEVRDLRPDDWPEVARIYADGIATGDATFETEVPSWEAWDAAHLPEHRFAAVADGKLVGWIAALPVSPRRVYRGVLEHSVYVDTSWQGKGVGRALLEALIESTERAGVWMLQTSIFPENLASLALHERCGFRVVGRRARIGQHEGRWRDTLLLERRSEVIE